MGGPERSHHPLYLGEISFLYLLSEYHRQGIGRQLTNSVVKRLVEQDMDSLLIRVLKENASARRFYEALGGQLVLEEQFEERGAVLVRVGYGWRDVSELLHSTWQSREPPMLWQPIRSEEITPHTSLCVPDGRKSSCSHGRNHPLYCAGANG
jgi:FR47-like protein